MRNPLHLVLFVFIVVLGTLDSRAQEKLNDIQKATCLDEDEKDPVMFRFEPDFVKKNEERKTEIARTRKMIDTLNVSDRKRLRLLKDLYKNGLSKRLKKALLVDTNFAEVE